MLSQLGKIEYIITEKLGIITEERVEVKVCAIKDKVFYAEDRNNSDYFSEDYIESDFYLNNSENLNTSSKRNLPNFKDIKAEILDSVILKDSWYFFMNLAICNEFIQNDEMKCIKYIDQSLKDFAKSLGVKIESTGFKSLKVMINGEGIHYQVLYTQTSKANTTRVALKNLLTDQVVLLVKGNKKVIQNLFTFDQLTILYQTLDSPALPKHKKKIVFGYKILSASEIKTMNFEIKNAKMSPINTEGRIEAIFETLEKDLNYSGFVYIDSPIVSGVKETIESLTNAGIKIWVATSDDEKNTHCAALDSGLISNDTKLIKLNCVESECECLKLMRSVMKTFLLSKSSYIIQENPHHRNSNYFILEPDKIDENYESCSLKKRRKKGRKISRSLVANFFEKKEDIFSIMKLKSLSLNFALSVDSTFFQYALSSEEHRKCFVILLFAAKTVLFNSFSYDQKVNIVKLLKKNFSFTNSVMSISRDYANFGMMSEADIGVKLGSIKKQSYEYCCIQMENFSQLTKLLLIYGHYSYYRYAIIFIVMIFKEFFLGTSILLFQTQS